MKDIIRLCLVLAAVCFCGAAALVYVNAKTLIPRQQAQQTALAESLFMVLPPETNAVNALELPLDKGLSFFLASDEEGRPLAVAGQGSTNTGFGGEVVVLVGLERDGRIRGVMVSKHSETPGLGTKATDRKQVKSLWKVLAGKDKDLDFPPNDYLDAYSGRQAGSFVLGGGSAEQRIDGISGATTSCQAVLAAVNRVCDAYNKNRDAIWAAQ